MKKFFVVAAAVFGAAAVVGYIVLAKTRSERTIFLSGPALIRSNREVVLTSRLTSRGYICTRNLTSTPIPDTPSACTCRIQVAPEETVSVSTRKLES